MTTVICPRCEEVLTILDGKDYVICPLCGNVVYNSN